ncbi:MAG: hypothetical protein ACTSR8_21670 [Promethearchaeota archaeon]
MSYPIKKRLVNLGGSHSITVPIKWIDENGLRIANKDDKKYITIKKFGNSLLLSPHKIDLNKRATIDLSRYKKPDHIKKLIAALYKWGFDEVTIKYSTSDQIKAIEELKAFQLPGFKFKQRDNKKKEITYINTITSSKDFKGSLQTLINSMKGMITDIISAHSLNTEDYIEQLKIIIGYDNQIDENADLLRRIINLGYDVGYYRNAPLYTIIEELEKVADNLKRLCYFLITRPKNKDEKIKSLLINFREKLEYYFYFLLEDFSQDNFLKCIELAPDPFPNSVEGILNLSLETLKNLNGPILQLHIHRFDSEFMGNPE